MIAEVISIGDELTSGQRLDTNSQWLSERLGELGIRVMYHTTVADDLEANVRVFRQAAERADLVVASGGLGPTADDLTREALAETVGQPLTLDQPSLEHIQRLFAHRKREMPASNRVQAMFPRGARVVPNPHGSAPGIDLDVVREGRGPSRIFALPGVPAEMREMWAGTVAPTLEALAGADRRMIRHRRIKCFGVGESDLEQMLPDLIRRGRDPQVGITVSKATITLRVTASGASPEACLAAMQPTLDTIRQCVGELAYGEEDDELQHVVVRRLAERGETLAVAEWGTRGQLIHWLDDASVGTDAFRGGLVVPGALSLAALGLTSEEVVEIAERPDPLVARMASRAREMFAADYGLAIGPCPPPVAAGGPPGEVTIALASAEGTRTQRFTFGGHPEILIPRAAKQALNLLRLALR